MYKISNKVINFIKKPMKNWKMELAVGEQTLEEVKIQNIPGRFTLATAITYINDVTQLYTKEVHREIQIYKIIRKD